MDLRDHGNSSPLDLSHTTMQDYAADVRAVASQLGKRPVLMGWSMGGLANLMLAQDGAAAACIGLAPSKPAREERADRVVEPGEVTPEDYGFKSRDPDQQPAMRDLEAEERAVGVAALDKDSRYARDQRGRGVVVTALACPFLLITGAQDRYFPASSYADLWLPCERLTMEAGHWGLPLNRRAIAGVLPGVTQWLEHHV